LFISDNLSADLYNGVSNPMNSREAQLQAKVKEQAQELSRLRQENTLLRQKVDLLSRRIFGCSSEKLSPAQLELLLGLAQGQEQTKTETDEPEPVVVLPRARKERKPRLPEDLPVVEEVIDPEPVKAQPQDWRLIGQEVTEQLDYEPSRFIRRRLIRRTFVHRTQKDLAPVTAALPPSLQERCLAAPGLLAQVVVSKYSDHLPLYRQQQIFKQRHGVVLSRQTLAGWIELVAEWMRPIYGHLREGVFGGGYVQIDETPVRYLCPGHGKTRQGYFWAANRPAGEVIYHWEISRAAACLHQVLPVDFKGTIQCDGYSAYDAFARQRSGEITLADCWAHVRRKFFEAKETAPRTAGWILRQIQHLYRIEAGMRQKGYSPKLRELIRAQQSRPLVERIGQACVRLRQSNRHLPQSPLGQALSYTLNQWKGLQVFVGDGRVEIDNNLVENAIRPTAVGKKNWLFIGEARAGQRSAILFTIIENCRRLGISSFDYLQDVLSRLPSMTNHQTHTLTPAAWAREQALNQQSALKLAS
jgi:transposase